MNFYVVGFAFNEEADHILLIHKNHPEWQKCKLNGIGGSIEPHESSQEAMKRECLEETGLKLEWVHKGNIWGTYHKDEGTFSCDVYYAYDSHIYEFVQREDEKLEIFDATEVCDYNPVIDNLHYLIAIGLYSNCKHFKIEY